MKSKTISYFIFVYFQLAIALADPQPLSKIKTDVPNSSATSAWASKFCSNHKSSLEANNDIAKKLNQVTCAQLRDSHACQSVYKEIEAGVDSAENYKIKCDVKKISSEAIDYEVSLIQGQIIFGCAIGAFDSVIGDFGRFLGESAAKLVTETEINSYCDTHPEYKKLLYLSHNADSPKELQIPVPSDKKLKSYNCSAVKRAIFEEHRYLVVKNNRKRGNTYDGEKGAGLISLAKKSLGDLGIRLECYNPQKAAELICKIAGYTASAVIPLTIATKIKLAAGLSEGTVASRSAIEYGKVSTKIIEASSVNPNRLTAAGGETSAVSDSASSKIKFGIDPVRPKIKFGVTPEKIAAAPAEPKIKFGVTPEKIASDSARSKIKFSVDPKSIAEKNYLGLTELSNRLDGLDSIEKARLIGDLHPTPVFKTGEKIVADMNAEMKVDISLSGHFQFGGTIIEVAEYGSDGRPLSYWVQTVLGQKRVKVMAEDTIRMPEHSPYEFSVTRNLTGQMSDSPDFKKWLKGISNRVTSSTFQKMPEEDKIREIGNLIQNQVPYDFSTYKKGLCPVAVGGGTCAQHQDIGAALYRAAGFEVKQWHKYGEPYDHVYVEVVGKSGGSYIIDPWAKSIGKSAEQRTGVFKFNEGLNFPPPKDTSNLPSAYINDPNAKITPLQKFDSWKIDSIHW
ncbi:MAG: hypothetical protein H7235_06950 [Bdellovibrionaceae bacterium]|nr:hypothetical protein [Pseudobdellovibrionaceae bacterium]